MEALSGEIERHGYIVPVRMGVYPNTRPLRRNIRSRTSGLPYAIDNGVFQFQRTKVRMRDRRMATAEIAREGRTRGEMRRPVDPTRGRVKTFSVYDVKPPKLEEHPIGDTRFETGAIRGAQRARESDAG